MTSQAFFRGSTGRLSDPLAEADRLEIKAYDSHRQVIGQMDLTGRVQLRDLVDITPERDGVRLRLDVSGYQFDMPIGPESEDPVGAVDTPEVRTAIEVLRRSGWRLTKREERGVMSDLWPDCLGLTGNVDGAQMHRKLILQTPWEPTA